MDLRAYVPVAKYFFLGLLLSSKYIPHVFLCKFKVTKIYFNLIFSSYYEESFMYQESEVAYI